MRTNLLALALCVAIGLSYPAVANAQSMYGALSNFDVFNDAGEDAHGFEIELDGLTSNDVTSYFGSPNTQYGNPTIVNFNGGVYVRYTSPYDAGAGAFTITTPIATNMSNTGGHSCWYGGSSGYPGLGCEHFGVGTGRNPTAVKYRWLVADPANPGSLIAHTPDVAVPSVTWTTTPPPVPNNPPVVVAEVEPPVPANGFQFSDAYWVKVYVTQWKRRLALNQLVTDNPAVPNLPSETEAEWEIFQKNPNLPGLGKLRHQGNLNRGSYSVVRRLEFYKYTGAYDAETHEALCADGSCNVPGPGELGDYLGAQMTASNFTQANQVTSVTVQKYNFVYDANAHTYSGTVVLRNTGVTAIAGPVEVVFTSLPLRTTMVSPTGKFLTYPYILVPSLSTAGSSLAPGQMTTFPVVFNATKAFNFIPMVYSGAF